MQFSSLLPIKPLLIKLQDLVPRRPSVSSKHTNTRHYKAILFCKMTTPTKSDADLKKRCGRVIYQNKYERNAPEISCWWRQLFKLLEDDATIPPEEQPELVAETFDKYFLLKVLKICKTRERQCKEPLPVPVQELAFGRLHDKDEEIGTQALSNAPVVDIEELDRTAKEIRCRPPGAESDHVIDTSDEALKVKMYMDFFKRKPSRAAVWRTLPPLSMEEMNLNQKAEAVTEKIATDFINWLRDLGGDEELSLSVQSIIEMFEIGFQANSATSLKVKVAEIASVPRRVAEAKGVPNRAKRSMLHREIRKDVNASKKKTLYTAFGKHLPRELQLRPPAENYYRKWISCEKVPEKLASMATVWQGITHLKSTRAFCEFLIEKPEIKPPQFLADCGMMDPRNLQNGESGSDIASANFSMASSHFSSI